jgi:PilZ domain
MYDSRLKDRSFFANDQLEDRCAPRTRLAIPAMLRVSGAKAFQSTVLDLSLGGFSTTSCSRIFPGTKVWLTLPNLSPKLAEVVWWENSQVGCAFDQLLSPLIHDPLVQRWAKDGFILSNH